MRDKNKISSKVFKRPIKAQMPNLTANDEVIMPNSLPQLQFINSTAYECFYAGSNGSGKTFALCIAASKNYENSNYQGVIFRNTMKEVKLILLKETKKIYPKLGGIYNHTDHVWTFPSGAKIYLSYLANADHIDKYLGSEFQFVGFDELKTFSEEDYLGLMRRLRSTDKTIKRVIRATSNPYADWVYYRYNQWLNHNHTACVEALETCVKAKTHKYNCVHCIESGKILNVDGIVTQVIMGHWWENTHSVDGTPEYEQTLKSGRNLDVAYYYYNDWTVREAEGMYFKRKDFNFVDTAPSGCKTYRAWDLAFSLKGDYTVGVKIGVIDGIYYVIDMQRERINDSAELENLILNTAILDGKNCQISLPKEPAGAGGYQMNALSKILNGFQFTLRSEKVKTDRNTTAKEAKSLAFAGQVAAHNVKVVRAKWNAVFFEELEEFPLGKHDDIVDAVCGAYNSSIGEVYVKYKRIQNIRSRMF